MFRDNYVNYQLKIDEALAEIKDKLQDEFELDDDEACEIIETYGYEIREIKAVYTGGWEDAAESEARSLGLMTDANEEYFNLDKFEETLKESEFYIELSTGVVVCVER